MKKMAALAATLLLCGLCSCAGQQPQMMGRMIDPTVIEISKDGQTAKVNMGVFDGVHGGQRLYVARQNKLVGVLTVRKIDAYSSECLVVSSTDVSEGNPDATLDHIRPGDNVHRELMGLTRPGMPKEKVLRMVPVPYEAQEKPVDTTQNPATTTDSTKTTVREIQPPAIPRDQVDDWIKTHPKLKTN